MSSTPGFDRTTWYQVTATSFSPLSFYGDWFTNGTSSTAVFMKTTNTTDEGQQWQFYQVSTNSYLIRCRLSGSDFYLGTFGSAPTLPAMFAADAVDMSAVWNVTAWGDGTYYLANNANGTGYHLSTNSTGTLFLDPSTTKKDSQRFSFKDIGGIKVPSFGIAQIPGLNISESSARTTNAAALPSATNPASTSMPDTSASSPSSPPPSQQTLSSSTIAAVVLAVLFGVAFMGLAGVFLYTRHSKKRKQEQKTTHNISQRWNKEDTADVLLPELGVKIHPSVRELPDHSSRDQELPA